MSYLGRIIRTDKGSVRKNPQNVWEKWRRVSPGNQRPLTILTLPEAREILFKLKEEIPKHDSHSILKLDEILRALNYQTWLMS